MSNMKHLGIALIAGSIAFSANAQNSDWNHIDAQKEATEKRFSTDIEDIREKIKNHSSIILDENTTLSFWSKKKTLNVNPSSNDGLTIKIGPNSAGIQYKFSF